MGSWWTEAGWTAVSEPGPGQQISYTGPRGVGSHGGPLI